MTNFYFYPVQAVNFGLFGWLRKKKKASTDVNVNSSDYIKYTTADERRRLNTKYPDYLSSASYAARIYKRALLT